jgi:hypothetical protein
LEILTLAVSEGDAFEDFPEDDFPEDDAEF